MLSREWRCSWSSADRRCSNYIWVIDNFIAYKGASYIRGFTVASRALLITTSFEFCCTRKPCSYVQCATLQWRHNERGSVSNHWCFECLLNHLLRRRLEKTPKFRVIGLYRGIHQSPVNSPHKVPMTWKMLPFDDVFMNKSISRALPLFHKAGKRGNMDCRERNETMQMKIQLFDDNINILPRIMWNG